MFDFRHLLSTPVLSSFNLFGSINFDHFSQTHPVPLRVQGALSSLSSTSGSCEPWSRRLLQFPLAQDNPTTIHHITHETQWQMDEDLDLYSIGFPWILFKMDSGYLFVLVATLSRRICLILCICIIIYNYINHIYIYISINNGHSNVSSISVAGGI